MKKIITLFMSLLLAITTLSVFAVSASAGSIFDDAKTMKPLTNYDLAGLANKSTYYKISVDYPGTVTFFSDSVEPSFSYQFIDSNGNKIKAKGIFLNNESYTVTKSGTYYLACKAAKTWDTKATNVYYTFTPSEEPTINLSISAYEGDVINLSGVTTNYKGKISWKSSNKKVATVSNGEVTAIKAGKTKITASLSNGKEAVITINVKKNIQPTVSLAINVTIGDEIDLSAITQNYKGDITWNVTDKKVISVNDGKISTLKKGKAKVRAYTDDGIFAEITINVK